jgi:isoamylase
MGYTLESGKSLAVFLNGKAIPSPNPKGEAIIDDSYFVLFNSHHEALPFILPERRGRRWETVLDTGGKRKSGDVAESGDRLDVEARSVVLLRHIE